jgi:hypothetical protein
MDGYTLAVPLCIIFKERYFASFSSFHLQKPWRSLCKTKVLQQHSVGTTDHGLSFYRVLSVTGHDGTPFFSKQTAETASPILCNKDAFCPLLLWCLQCCCWHSAGCRTSWVCLQHHATLVTSNVVSICGRKFPPTVSKHCQHQHSSILKMISTIRNTNNPSCCHIQAAASSVQQHGSLCSEQQHSPLWCLFRPAKI